MQRLMIIADQSRPALQRTWPAAEAVTVSALFLLSGTPSPNWLIADLHCLQWIS
jgi:hypothetical protein